MNIRKAGILRNTRQWAAFSLVEVLVVIAIIGILGAISLRSIGKIREASLTAEKQRTAFDVATVYAAAQAAGYDFRYDTGATGGEVQTVEEMINKIIDGIKITNKGTLEGASFSLPGLDNNKRDWSVAGASEYLIWDEKVEMLVYKRN